MAKGGSLSLPHWKVCKLLASCCMHWLCSGDLWPKHCFSQVSSIKRYKAWLIAWHLTHGHLLQCNAFSECRFKGLHLHFWPIPELLPDVDANSQVQTDLSMRSAKGEVLSPRPQWPDCWLLTWLHRAHAFTLWSFSLSKKIKKIKNFKAYYSSNLQC